jgi:hypothetical protein
MSLKLTKNDAAFIMGFSVILYFFLQSLVPVFAQPQNTTQYCLDNTTLIRTINSDLTLNGVPKNLSLSENVVCQFGCDVQDNICYPNPIMKTLIPVGIGLALVVIALIILRVLRVI